MLLAIVQVNLIKVIESTKNPKEKTTALRALGEVDGVDAFKKKTEVTHKMETMEEVEKELLTMLNDFKKNGLMKEPAGGMMDLWPILIIPMITARNTHGSPMSC